MNQSQSVTESAPPIAVAFSAVLEQVVAERAELVCQIDAKNAEIAALKVEAELLRATIFGLESQINDYEMANEMRLTSMSIDNSIAAPIQEQAEFSAPDILGKATSEEMHPEGEVDIVEVDNLESDDEEEQLLSIHSEVDEADDLVITEIPRIKTGAYCTIDAVNENTFKILGDNAPVIAPKELKDAQFMVTKLYKKINAEKSKLDEFDDFRIKLYNKARSATVRYAGLTYAGTKLTEMISTFRLLERDSTAVVLDLCSCPGDFMRALKNVRTWRPFFPITSLHALCVGLNDDYHPEVKDMTTVRRMISDVTQMSSFDKISSAFKSLRKGVPDMILCDGACPIEKKENYNHQEVINHKLLLAQCLHALKNVGEKTTVIIKILGYHSVLVLQIISLFANAFSTCHIHKPQSSKPANDG
jgi:23S rRNA U2552 (ribose-2'-O)-methylase RlmE/FtsJ